MTIKKLLPLLILSLLIAGCESKSDRRKHLCAEYYANIGDSKRYKLVEEFGIVVSSGKYKVRQEQRRVGNACEFYKD